MPAPRVSPVDGRLTGLKAIRSPGSLPWGLRSLTGDPDRARGVLLPDEAQHLTAAKPESGSAPAAKPAPSTPHAKNDARGPVEHAQSAARRQARADAAQTGPRS